MTKRICVTGAAGRAGRVTVRELLAHGYRVVATDRVMPPEAPGVRRLLADLTDYGQATEVLQEVDAVVHLANTRPRRSHSVSLLVTLYRSLCSGRSATTCGPP